MDVHCYGAARLFKHLTPRRYGQCRGLLLPGVYFECLLGFGPQRVTHVEGVCDADR